MDHIFNYVYALGLTPDERDRIAKIQAVEPDSGDLQIFEMIVEALPDHSVALVEEFEEWVDSIEALEREYYEAEVQYDLLDRSGLPFGRVIL